MAQRRTKRVPAVLAGLALALLVAPMAEAETAEPGVPTTAWYWKDQKQQAVPNPGGGGDAATVNAPNPFCPAAEGAGAPEPTCKSGRLPIEVRGGDYKTPNMLPAVAFDLTLVPLGSTVSKFTATFREANDEQSQPVNAEGKKLQACIVNDVFGSGEARLYKEVPKFNCPARPIAAKREVVKGKKTKKGEDQGPKTFEWTFDLTGVAKKWVKQGAFATAVLIRPLEPKKAGAQDNSWRVVLSGPEEKKGITTQLVYSAPPLDADASDPVVPGGDVPGGSTSGSLVGSGSSAASGSATTNVDSGPATNDTGATEDPGTAEAPQPVAASERVQEIPGGLPAYVWLGLLLGILGFSLVRSVVVEKTAGVRPNGVMAQIRRLNAERRGTSSPASVTGAASDNQLTSALKSVRHGAGTLLKKLPIKNKGA